MRGADARAAKPQCTGVMIFIQPVDLGEHYINSGLIHYREQEDTE